MTWLRAWFAWESVLLFVVCLADMLSTLYWVHIHAAVESNPWMALLLQHGDATFCAGKLLSVLPLLAITAYYRPRRPRLIAVALRGTLALYVLIYLAAVMIPTFLVGPTVSGPRDISVRHVHHPALD